MVGRVFDLRKSRRYALNCLIMSALLVGGLWSLQLCVRYHSGPLGVAFSALMTLFALVNLVGHGMSMWRVKVVLYPDSVAWTNLSGPEQRGANIDIAGVRTDVIFQLGPRTVVNFKDGRRLYVGTEFPEMDALVSELYRLANLAGVTPPDPNPPRNLKAEKRFRGRVHLLVLIGVVVFPLILFAADIVTAVKAGRSASLVVLIPSALSTVLLVSILNIKIEISGDIVVIRYILFGARIPIHDIQVVNDTAVNPRLTLMALNFATSPGWLEIGYVKRGKARWVTVSPADKLGLMESLAKVDPKLVLANSKLERR